MQFENPDWQVAGFTIQERVTRFKHFNTNKYYLKMGAGPDRVFWEFGKQGAPFLKDKEFLFKTKVGPALCVYACTRPLPPPSQTNLSSANTIHVHQPHRVQVALNKTNVATRSYTWEMVCEFKWLNATGAEVYEVVPIEKTTTVTVTGCK